MNLETRNCQNCKKDFILEQEDFKFYKKMQVPPPTFCFLCRLQRKLVFRNERGLYNAVCDLCDKNILSVVPNCKGNLIYCVSCWTGENWQPEKYGHEYDFSESFFKQFKKLLHAVPIRALTTSDRTNVNTEYSNTSSNLKNCYLIYGSDNCQDSMYGTEITHNSNNCIDCMITQSVSNAYESINCDHCDNIRSSIDCKDSLNILYSKNLSGCSDCLACVNLRNKKYCIFNEQLSEKEYREKIKNFRLNTYSGHVDICKKSKVFFEKFPVKYFHGFSNVDFSGDYIYKSKNIKTSFIIAESENCKYCYNIVVKGAKDCMDYSDWGSNAEKIYESQSCGVGISNMKFCFFVTRNSLNCEYSAHCANCQNIFGCVGLRNKQYYIFNKKYTQEEYFKLKEKIIKQMDIIPYVDKKNITYRYGEFFPAEISIFPYDDTTAQDIFTLSKEEASSSGFSWSQRSRNNKFQFTFSDIPDDINDVGIEFTDRIIMCKNNGNQKKYPYCTEGYKILERELSFYKRNNIPLPRYCFNCRYYQRLSQRNGVELFHRRCMKRECKNEFETTYIPSGPEIVYCEKCYQQEIY